MVKLLLFRESANFDPSKSPAVFTASTSFTVCNLLFLRSEEMNEEDIMSTEPLFTSKQQGLLRTKIEAGKTFGRRICLSD